jgi:hypothetical protein
MASSSEQERRANRRFWLGIGGFFALLAVILGLGPLCAADEPDLGNAQIVRPEAHEPRSIPTRTATSQDHRPIMVVLGVARHRFAREAVAGQEHTNSHSRDMMRS